MAIRHPADAEFRELGGPNGADVWSSYETNAPAAVIMAPRGQHCHAADETSSDRRLMMALP